MFVQDRFCEGDNRELYSLPNERSIRGKKQIPYKLLRDGGRATLPMLFYVFFRGDSDLIPIETVMLVKASVFGGYNRVLEVQGDSIERHESRAFRIGGGSEPGTDAPFDLDRGGGRVDVTKEDEAEANCDVEQRNRSHDEQRYRTEKGALPALARGAPSDWRTAYMTAASL